MDAVVFTKSVQEYEMLSRIFVDELPETIVELGKLDGDYHLEHKYDIVVIDVDGALGMELVYNYREMFDGTFVIWITNDPYFAGVAIRTRIFDFIVRPLEEIRFRETVRKLRKRKFEWKQKLLFGKDVI